MKNLISLQGLELDEIRTLLETARKFKNGLDYSLKGKIIANLFFEPSTRTQYSFNVAEEKLDMKVVNFNSAFSSLIKGESFYDTVKTFTAFGVDALVIRHFENKYYDELRTIKIPIINGGDGTNGHPSQTLLDLFTIFEEYNTFAGLKVAIIGDIKHSRVAHEGLDVMKRLGMECYITGYNEYLESDYPYIDFERAIEEMDIIMLLRIQVERHSNNMSITKEEYFKKYGLTLDKVKRMKERAIIMHPAPFNRGIEIDDDVVECPKSRIFEQIENGVYIRQSILKWCFE